MKIAQVAPLFESVPPQLYGGTERIVSALTEELIRQGHQVTLFASGDSITKARLFAPCPRALRLDSGCREPLVYHTLMYERVLQEANDFDLIHFHSDIGHFPLSRRLHVPVLHTLHGRLDLPELVPLFQEFRDMPVTSISHAQRKPLPWLNWQGTVHHGLSKGSYAFAEKGGEYLAFLGRISPEKQVDHAIEIARRAGMRVKVAAKIDRQEQDYYDRIRHLLKAPHVEFVGEIGEADKSAFLGGARALLFPINWPEPFGLVMIEALACGTPVIGYRRGSVPEVLDHGKTGYVVETLDQAVKAVQRLDHIDRKECRRVFEQRFACERMVESYLSLYHRLILGEVESMAV